MNKKHGFTLIELLAVIVVLAIIVLIATPIVTTTIKNTKKGSAELSAQHYVKAVELAISNSELNKKHIQDGTYTIDGEGNLTGSSLPNGKLEIEATGTKPNGGTIVIKNGQVTTESTIGFTDYDVKYDSTSKEYVATEKGSSTTPDTPQVEVLCTANTSKASALVWTGSADPGQESSYTRQAVGLLVSESGAYTPGVTYTCELGDNESNTFYVLETNGDNVSLIAGFNLGSTVAWSSDGSNHKDEDESAQAKTAKAALKERTSGWTKLTESQITLPSASQIATAVGKTFDETNGTSGLPTWLNSYTKSPVTYGYWTSTPGASDSSNAWGVSFGSSLNSSGVAYGGGIGIRPVITISKSNLS